jgi:hypothetical protein
MPSDQTTDQQAGTVGSTDTTTTTTPGSTDTSMSGTAGSSSDVMNKEAKTPKDVCNRLIEAAKKDDFSAADQYTLWNRDRMSSDQQAGTMGSSKKSMKNKMEKGFHKVHREHLSMLKNLTCGSETLAGDHAFVETDSQQGKRLIPFVQQGGQWKFDAHTYMSFYPESAKEMKSSS